MTTAGTEPTTPVWITRAYGTLLMQWRCQCGDSGRSRSWGTAIRAAHRHARAKHRTSAEIVP